MAFLFVMFCSSDSPGFHMKMSLSSTVSNIKPSKKLSETGGK
jgi:hypothetical protein